MLLASAWLLPFASEYSLIGDNISEMALGRYGFVQTTAFLISGLTTVGLAFAIQQLTIELVGLSHWLAVGCHLRRRRNSCRHFPNRPHR